MEHQILIDILLGCMLLVALYTDIARGKIYNALTFPCVFGGIALNTCLAGWIGLQTAGLGLLVGAAVFVVIALLRLMSGGDAKLLVAVGAFKGWEFLVYTLLFTALAGGVLAVCFLLYKRLLRATVSDIGSKSFARFVLRAPIDYMPTLRAGRLPYSIAIAAGAALTFWRTCPPSS